MYDSKHITLKSDQQDWWCAQITQHPTNIYRDKVPDIFENHELHYARRKCNVAFKKFNLEKIGIKSI